MDGGVEIVEVVWSGFWLAGVRVKDNFSHAGESTIVVKGLLITQ